MTICIEALEDEHELSFDRCDGTNHYRFCPLYEDGPAMHGCAVAVHHVWPRAGGYHFVGRCPEREPWER